MWHASLHEMRSEEMKKNSQFAVKCRTCAALGEGKCEKAGNKKGSGEQNDEGKGDVEEKSKDDASLAVLDQYAIQFVDHNLGLNLLAF